MTRHAYSSIATPHFRTKEEIATLMVEPLKRGLRDQDRIFDNLYAKHDRSLKGVMARVCFNRFTIIIIVYYSQYKNIFFQLDN
jgi:hypothetical protein